MASLIDGGASHEGAMYPSVGETLLSRHGVISSI